MDQFKTNVFNVISKAAGEGLHYALWIANYELNIVYKDVGSRDRAVKSIMESSEVMAYVKKEGVKTLTGIHTKFHMCWTLPRGYMSPESLLADLKRHFAQVSVLGVLISCFRPLSNYGTCRAAQILVECAIADSQTIDRRATPRRTPIVKWAG